MILSIRNHIENINASRAIEEAFLTSKMLKIKDKKR